MAPVSFMNEAGSENAAKLRKCQVTEVFEHTFPVYVVAVAASVTYPGLPIIAAQASGIEFDHSLSCHICFLVFETVDCFLYWK